MAGDAFVLLWMTGFAYMKCEVTLLCIQTGQLNKEASSRNVEGQFATSSTTDDSQDHRH